METKAFGKKRLALMSMTMGGVSLIIFMMLSLLYKPKFVPIPIIGIILGIIGINSSKKKIAKAGILLNIISILLQTTYIYYISHVTQ